MKVLDLRFCNVCKDINHIPVKHFLKLLIEFCLKALLIGWSHDVVAIFF